MATKVPFPRISGVPDRAVFELQRNFEALGDATSQGVGVNFDAVVDGSLAADNTALKQFTTCFAAIKYVGDTVGKTNMTIGVLSSGSTITEVGNYTGTTSGLTIRLVSIGNFERPLQPTQEVIWALGGFRDASSKFRSLICTGLAITGWPNGNANPFMPVGGAVLQFYDCRLAGTVDSYMAGTAANWAIAFYNTRVQGGFTFTGGSSSTMFTFDSDIGIEGTTLSSCSVSWNVSQLYSYNTQWGFASGCANAITLTLSADIIVMDSSATPQAYSPGSTNFVIFTVSGATSLYWRTNVPPSISASTYPMPDLIITSGNLKTCYIDGVFRNLTVPAMKPAGSSAFWIVNAVVQNQADLTGPGRASLSMSANSAFQPTTFALRLRGSALNVDVAMSWQESVAAATLLDYISCTRSVVTAAIQRQAGANTGDKVYAFDAGSTHNILILETDAFGTASTDAGSNNLVITDTGTTPSGAAGGDLTGSYPNPTLAAIGAATGPIGDGTHVPVVTIDAKGRVTVLGTAVITTGAAGVPIFSTAQVDLGALPQSGGTFDIGGLAGLTAGKAVAMWLSSTTAPTGANTVDLLEWDNYDFTAFCLDATHIRVYWSTSGFVAGKIAVDYVITG